MKDKEFDFIREEPEDEETMEELKKLSKQKNKNFASVINKKKLNRYDLDEVML